MSLKEEVREQIKLVVPARVQLKRGLGAIHVAIQDILIDEQGNFVEGHAVRSNPTNGSCASSPKLNQAAIHPGLERGFSESEIVGLQTRL